MVMLAVNKKMG